MNLDEIKELIQVVMETGVAELEVRRGEDSVRIRRSASATDLVYAGQPAPVATPTAAVPAAVPLPAAPSTQAAEPASEANLITVKSPIVGTYYDAASPGSAPFIKVGDTIQPGQVLCIIESMKLMNEIEAEVAGVVVSKLVENGRAVEYGETLFTVRPK